MKVYEVAISGTIEVEAESADEASRKANGLVDLDMFKIDYVHELYDLGDQE